MRTKQRGVIRADPTEDSQAGMYLSLLRSFPEDGLTDWEAARLLGIERNSVNARRKPLVDFGQVHHDGWRLGPSGMGARSRQSIYAEALSCASLGSVASAGMTAPAVDGVAMELKEALTALFDEYHLDEFVECVRDEVKGDPAHEGLSSNHPKVRRFKEMCRTLKEAMRA